MIYPMIISPALFDTLSDEDKLKYWYCDRCDRFIMTEYSKKCFCEEG